MNNSKIEVGTEIYYTGDMANHSGFFKVTKVEDQNISMVEIEEDGLNRGRNINTPVWGIGTTYEGHMGTRFVTRAAYNAYNEAMHARMAAS